MKTIKEIYEEFINKHECSYVYSGKDEFWDFYACASGFIKDEFFSICFSKKKHIIKIQLENQTDNPKNIAKLIKEIEPKSKVTYYQTETIQKEITI